MADTLTPFVYWGQSNNTISLKVDLQTVEDLNVSLTEEGLNFEAQGLGVKGLHQYGFYINFYLPVDPEKSKYRKTDIAVEFQIQKVGSETWPRLTHDRLKLAWLKIDFDKFPVDDSEAGEDSEMDNTDIMQEDLINKMSVEMKSKDLDKITPRQAYLFFYNLFQFVGYSFIFCRLLYIYFIHGHSGMDEAFETVGSQMVLCQAVAVMEVTHALCGLVKSSVFSVLTQVVGRNMVLFLLVLQEPRLQISSVCWWLFVVWSFVEVIRYPFYLLQLVGLQVKILTWLRYSIWILLYPLGILVEGAIVFKSITYFGETGFFSITLPNASNMAFYFPYFLVVHLILIALGGTNNMKYMYVQRKKQLGSTVKAKKSKTS